MPTQRLEPTSSWKAKLGWAIAVGSGVVALGCSAAILAGSALARRVVDIEHNSETPVTVESLERSSDGIVAWISGAGALHRGKHSLVFNAGEGHARLGPVSDARGDVVARAVVAVDSGDLQPGARGRMTGWWYVNPSELGYRTERITFSTELGEADAWIVHPRIRRKKRWAIHTHGRGASPVETIRGVAPLARAGITSMIISYRNDAGAPDGENGRYGIGVAESRDIEAAISEAKRRGAQRVTLVGWSMGGTASLVTAISGNHAGVIDGLILDSPAVDWAALLHHHAKVSHAPTPVADIGIRMLTTGAIRGGVPGGIDFTRLTAESFAKLLDVPVLIHASDGDTYVPSAGAKELAARRPDLVQLRLYPDAEHVRLWNAFPEKWERVTEAFAKALPRPAWRGE